MASSSSDSDIRQQVEESRGVLKKLQLLVPGLKGYRELEDIRVSDELLRNQVADRLDRARGNLEALRKKMVNGNDLTNLSAVASMISQVQQLSGEVRHAQQGYSGFAATIRIDESKLNSLYEYDYQFVSSAAQLEAQTSPSSLVYDASSPNSAQATLSRLGDSVSETKQRWTSRVEAIEGILLK